VSIDGGLPLGAGAHLPFVVAVLDADGVREIVPVERSSTEADGRWSVEGASTSFRARASGAAPSGPAGRRAVRLTIECAASQPVEAGLRFELRLRPTDQPGWLIPGCFYGENRPAGCARRFPRFVTGPGDIGAMESPAWSFRADRASTPAVFGWDGEGGAALVTTETALFGECGMGFALEDGRPALRLHFPLREEPLRYDGSEIPAPPEARLHVWRPGEAVTAEIGLYLLGADRHEYTQVLRDVHMRGPASGGVAWVSAEEAAELAAWGLYRWHYRPEPPVLLETAAFDREALGERGDRQAMHVSWVSGAPYAHALLRHGRRRGSERYVEAAASVLDHIAANLAPGGTFWGQWTASDGWRNGWHPDRRRLHARTLGEATLFLLRAAVDESGAGHERPDWEAAVRSNLDVACRAQRADGALGAAHDAGTGDVLSWEGTAGLAWIAPLVEAAAALAEPRYLDAAWRAGEYFLRFVEAEFLYGAPEDVDLAPTSEDGYVAVAAYVALHEHDGGERWLAAARRAADWMLTFRYTYDVAFSPRTLLGTYGFRTRGADQASPANQHLHAYGLICLPEMVRLARATGDPYYLESTRENFACFRQFIAREDGDFDAYRGMASERYYQTDCFQAKGMLLTLSHAWSVGVLLLACEAAATEFPELA